MQPILLLLLLLLLVAEVLSLLLHRVVTLGRAFLVGVEGSRGGRGGGGEGGGERAAPAAAAVLVFYETATGHKKATGRGETRGQKTT